MAIHGKQEPGARTARRSRAKDGSVRVLVATDIAARGIDVDQLPRAGELRTARRFRDIAPHRSHGTRSGASERAMSLVMRKNCRC